jgi:hypothetical protein
MTFRGAKKLAQRCEGFMRSCGWKPGEPGVLIRHNKAGVVFLRHNTKCGGLVVHEVVGSRKCTEFVVG